LHAGFALGKNGETVSLYDASTNRVDALTFGLQLTDYTVGRVGDELAALTMPTPGAANPPRRLASPTNLGHQRMARGFAARQRRLDRTLQSFRQRAGRAARSGLRHEQPCFQYQALSFVAPQGFVQLFADELPGANHLEFKLPAAGGAIVLYDETAGTELERVTYGLQIEAVTEGRCPTARRMSSRSPAAQVRARAIINSPGPGRC
jgi:hypothetical protein